MEWVLYVYDQSYSWNKPQPSDQTEYKELCMVCEGVERSSEYVCVWGGGRGGGSKAMMMMMMMCVCVCMWGEVTPRYMIIYVKLFQALNPVHPCTTLYNAPKAAANQPSFTED